MNIKLILGISFCFIVDFRAVSKSKQYTKQDSSDLWNNNDGVNIGVEYMRNWVSGIKN